MVRTQKVPAEYIQRSGAAVSRDFPARTSPDEMDDRFLQDELAATFDDTGPSLPVILMSAACGVALGIIGLYLTYTVAGWGLPASVFVAALGASAGLGIAGAGLTGLTGSNAAAANITMSCGLIVISLAFLGLCMLVGALAATLLLVTTG